MIPHDTILSTMKKRMSKLYRKRSPTTAAGVDTTRIAKRNQEMTVYSEDLTASEFATMTGIKIDLEAEIGSRVTDACSTTTSTTSDSSSSYNIWDSEFWEHENHIHKSRASYVSSIPTTIQKGRFKIMWGQQEEQNITKVSTAIPCVEWKRKRVSFSSSLNENISA